MLGLSLAACGVVSAGFSNDEAPRAGTNGGQSGDELPIRNEAGSPVPPEPDARRTGNPLCGDPTTAECWPDDPRQDPVCGNTPAPTDDSGSGTSSSGGSNEEDESPDAGEPIEDSGTAALPQACRVHHPEAGTPRNTCVTAGSGVEGASCKHGEDCGAGLDCVQGAGDSGSAGTCRAYCCESLCSGVGNSGSEGRFCDPTRRVDDASRVPACLPIKSCRLLGKDECGKNETCAVVREIDGSTGCVEIGNAVVGESCDVEHCAAGLTCLGQVGTRTCFQLCSDSGAACPTGQECTWAPPAFREAGLGICTGASTQRLY